MTLSTSKTGVKIILSLFILLISSTTTTFFARAAIVANPTFSVASGVYSETQSVTLGSETADAIICYTTNGVNPAAVTAGTCSSGTPIASGSSISVSATQTVKALATLADNENSAIVSATYIFGDTIAFTTTGGTFAPIITVASGNIFWVFGDGQDSNSAAPSITFADAQTRINYLQVSSWSAVTKINLGYDSTHGGTSTGSGETTFVSLPAQNVSAITGLGNVASSLVRWSSLGGTMTSLDFSGFTALTTIECYRCNSLSSINLDGVSALSRLNLETSAGTGLSGSLDLSDCPNITDLRLGSVTPASIVWPTAGISSLATLSYHDNAISAINLSGATGLANLELDDNQLSELDLSGLSSLKFIDLDDNSLTQAELDEILATVDGFATAGGYLDIQVINSVIPSLAGQNHMNKLIERGWTVITNGYTLTLSKAGNGGTGTIATTIGAQSITSDSSFYADKIAAATGTSITLAATPDAGSTFAGWTGGGCSGTGTCTLTLTANTTVSASFMTTGAPGIRGPITYVDNHSSALGNTISAAPRVHTQGNLIAVFVGAFKSDNDFSVSDTQNNDYIPVGTRIVADASSVTGQWFYAIAEATGENTVTATSGTNTGVNTNNNKTIRVLEYSGIDTSSPLDVNVNNTGATTGNITTTSRNGLLLSAWHTEGSYSCSVTSGSFGFVPDTNNFCASGSVARPVAQKIVSAIQANATTSISNTRRESWGSPSRNWVVSFKGAAAAAPTFSIAAGTYASAQSITLSSATSGATICYTTDGTTPGTDGAGSCSGASTLTYSEAINVSSTQTVRAITTKSGYNDSMTAISTYVIGAGIQGPISHAAVMGNSTAASSVSAAATTHTAGNMLAVFVAANNPGNISVNDTQGNTYAEVDSLFAGTTGISGQWYYAFVGNTGSNTVTATFSNSAANFRTIRVLEYANIDRNNPFDVNGVHDSYASGTLSATSSTFDTDNANELILAAWHLEGAGTCAAGEGYALLANDYCGSGVGRPVEQKLVSAAQNDATATFSMTISAGAESYARVYRSWIVSFNEAAPSTPTFSVPAGTYVPAQNITLSTATEGATICYTTDGTDPGASVAGTCDAGSTTYAGAPIAIGEGTTTLKALATKSGMNTGTVASATYTVTNVISFTTVGASFAPIITVTGTPTILWTFSDGTASASASPNKDFSTAATRIQTLRVTPWSALTKINLGYDGIDGGTAPGTGADTFASLAQQNVQAVSGLSLVRDSLALWASSYNPIIALDFSDFSALTKVECYDCGALTSIDIDNVSTIKRLGLEKDNLSALDLTDAAGLEDLRGSDQDDGNFSITWGAESYPALWHVCSWGNPNTGTIPFNKFPILRDYYIGGDNQTGMLNPVSTNLRSVLANDNGYTSADFSGNYPTGGSGIIDMDNNDLTSIDISDSPGLLRVDLHGNPLDQAQIDAVLHNLDSFGVIGDGTGTSAYDDPYYVNLMDTSAPSAEGQVHADNLIARGWTILTDQVTLTVNRAGTGGTGTIAGGSIDCGSTCSASVDPGDVVTLTATPGEGSTFDGWVGGECSGTGTCTVTVNANTAVAAIFGTTASGIQGPITHAAVAGNGTGAGSVSTAATVHTEGNMLAVFTGGVNPGTISVADTQGNTYHAIGSPYASSGIIGQWFYTFAGTTGTNTVTATFGSSTTTYRSIRTLEYANIDPINSVDVTGTYDSYTGNLTSATSSAFTTNYPNELILAAWMADGVTTCTGGDGYTLLPNTFCGAGVGRPVEEKKVSVIQTDLTASFNITGSVAWTGINRSWIVSFKAAKPAAATFSVSAGTYSSAQSVGLSSSTATTTICYTVDGTDPSAATSGTCDTGSSTYVSGTPVSIGEGTTTLRAIATKTGMNNSAVTSATYTVMSDAVAPSFSPAAGTYTGTQSITLSSSTPTATICYTVDGTDPTTDGAGTCTGGAQYSSAITVSSSKTVKAITTRSGYNDSTIASAIYTINTPSSSSGGSPAVKPSIGKAEVASISGNQVTLSLSVSNASKMQFSAKTDLSDAVWVNYASSYVYTKADTQTILYMRFRSSSGGISTMKELSLISEDSGDNEDTNDSGDADGDEGADNDGSTGNDSGQTSSYPDGTLIKLPDNPKIYVIQDGEKKWISTPEVFEQLGYQWTAVTTVSKDTLGLIADYEDNLIRIRGDYKVYLVVNGIRRHIPNPAVFLGYGFDWNDVRDVESSVAEKYESAYLIKESGKDDVYFVNSAGARKLIPNMDIFNSYGDKMKDVQIVSAEEMISYPISRLIRLSSDNNVYFIKNSTKKLIPTPDVFVKYGFDWSHVVNINQAEFDFYQDDGTLE